MKFEILSSDVASEEFVGSILKIFKGLDCLRRSNVGTGAKI